MYRRICFICLSENNLEIVYNKKEPENEIITKVKYLLPELTILDLRICSTCHKTLHSFYLFKKKCVENYNRLINNAKNYEPVIKQELKEGNKNVLVPSKDQDDIQIVEDSIDIKEELVSSEDENEDVVVSSEGQDNQKVAIENTIHIKQEFVVSDEENEDIFMSSEDQYDQKITEGTEEKEFYPHFVKCESYNMEDGGSSMTSEDDNLLTCNTNLSENPVLSQNTKLHTGDKNFKCSICNKVFSRNDNMKQHMKRHSGIKNFACSICNKRFTQAGNLRLHMKLHEGIKDFKCSVCDKLFSRIDNMKQHMKIHEGVKNHICSICNHRFAQTSHLKLHMKRHKDSDIELRHTPPEITTAANVASTLPLPKKSLEIYENTYKKFMKWRHEMNINSFSQNVILTYVAELAKNLKSSTLWSHYSMLKNTISKKHNINIGEYPKVRAYLKRKNEGYTPKKSPVLEREHIFKFITEAPDEKYLLTKVILIFGISGGLRREELYKLKTEDIDDFGTILVVTVPDTITKITRKFTISKYLELYKKYVALRPKNYLEKKFFIHFYAGKCVRRSIGINKFGKVPCEIAKYLKLPNSEEYTGHCFRRSSASLLVETEVDLLMSKQHEGCKSSAVENSLNTNMDTSNQIVSIENNSTTTTNSNIVKK